MNSLIESLNLWGSRLADLAFGIFIQSSLLILLLFALDFVIRQRVRAVFCYGLWMLVLIKLLLPPSLALPTGVVYWLPQKKTVQVHAVVPSKVVIHYSNVKSEEMPSLPALRAPRPTLRSSGWLLLGWLTVTVGLMACLARRSGRIANSTRQAIPAPHVPENLLDACRRQMRIGRAIRLKLSTRVSSPAVYGFLRPVILIPQQLADKLSALQLRGVLLHELAHIKRGDVLVHYAQTLLQILYWWHPLLWLANARIRHAREQAVDETVMVAMGGEAEAYPTTLLEVAKLTFQRPMLALGLIGIVESKGALSQRIKHLIERPVPKSARLGFGGVAVLFLAGALLLPMARAERKPNDDATRITDKPFDQVALIDLEVEFISTSTVGSENLGLGQPALAGAKGNVAWALSSQQREDLVRRLDPESVVLSAPPITTTSGREAKVEINGVEPFKHPKARASASYRITPRLNGNMIDLSISANMTEFGNVSSVIADDPGSGANQQNAVNEPGQVFTVNTAGHINYDVGVAQISVADGETVVVQNPSLTGAAGKRILVVVSARVVRQSASATPPNLNRVSVGRSSGPFEPSRVENNELENRPTKSTPDQPKVTATKDSALQDQLSVGEIRDFEHSRVPAGERLAELLGRYEAAHLKFRERSEQRRKQDVEQSAVRSSPVEWIVDVVGNPRTPLPGLSHGLPTDVFLDYLPVGLGGVERAFASIAASSMDNHVLIRVGAEAPSELILQMLDAVEDTGLQRFDIGIREETLADFAANVMKAVPVFGGDMPVLGRLFLDPHVERKLAADNDRNPIRPSAKVSSGQKQPTDATTFELAKKLFELGRFEAAEQKLRAVLDADPQNQEARYYLDLVKQAGVESERRGGKHRTWYPMNPLRPAVPPSRQPANTGRKSEINPAIEESPPETNSPGISTSAPSARVPVAGELPFLGPRREAIEAKLKQIILPEVAFDNVPLPKALRWLSEQASKLDPDGAGLNFLFNPSVIGAAQAMIDPNTGWWITLPMPEPLDMSRVRVRVHPALRNVRLGDAVKAIVETADTPIRYSVEDYSVVFSPRPAVVQQLETRTFRVDPRAFLEGLSRVQGIPRNAGTTNLDQGIQDAVRNFFAAAGVSVLPPNMLFFNQRTGLLMVRASAPELDLAQKTFETLNPAPAQITIETKFMEMPTDTARKLGFDLSPPGEISNTWVRVLTAAQARAVLHDAGQFAGVDILSAPKVTTLSGRQSQVQAVEIRSIVTGIKSEALTAPGVVSTDGTQGQPFLTSRIPCGPTLNLTPSVATDGFTIHLLAAPEVTEFVGYDTTLDGARKKSVWIDGEKQNIAVPLAGLRTRWMQAAAEVYDGQTLVLANPQVRVISHQPTGESLTNTIPEDAGKRLLVFITPTIIDPAGDPIHAPGKEPFPADKIPPQPPR